MAETNEVDDCLDELLYLLDEDDNNELADQNQIQNCTLPSSTQNHNEKYSNEDVICDMQSQTAGTSIQVQRDEVPCNIDPLEKELLLMEQKMKKLKEEIVKKKNLRPSDSHSKSFTKLSSVISPTVKNVESSARYLNNEEKSKLINDLKAKKSEIHSGDTDSEDEEDNRMPLEAQMTSYGREMKKRLAHSENNTMQKARGSGVWKGDSSSSLTPLGKHSIPVKKDVSSNVDPFSGIRIVNPLISNDTMKEMMYSRRMINLSSVVSQLRGGDIEGDWVTIGVIVSKSETKTSQKGTSYCIWQLSDLRDCTKIASVFLFAGAYKQLWKTIVGTVVGILNPQIMKDSNKPTDGRNVITMSVNNHEKVLLMGTSKDLGWCKGRSKQGSACRQFVNKNVCEFCVFHIQKEYKKMSAKTRRPELHSSFAKVDPRKVLQKKVLGRDQVFYGGQLFNSGESVPPRKKLLPAIKGKDLSALSSLSMKLKAETLKEKERKDSFVLTHLTDDQLSTVVKVTKENEELGQMLLAPTFGARNFLIHKSKSLDSKPKANPEESTQNQQQTLTAKEFLKLNAPTPSDLHPRTPQLGRGLSPGNSFEIELPSPSPNAAKMKALSLVRKKGGLPSMEKNILRNKDKSSKSEFRANIKKRVREGTDMEEAADDGLPLPKTYRKEDSELLKLGDKESLLGSVDINSEKFLKLMNVKSSHTNLIQSAEDEEVEKYYNTLEKKEMLENKMASTMEMQTSAVICLKCKYKSTSLAERCREEKHPFKVIKAVKRFFECRNCKQRTMSLEKLPTKPCSHCSQSTWKRVAMWKEKQGPRLESEVLSLRGDELSHVSSASNQVYLNL